MPKDNTIAEPSPADKAKATKWFEHGKSVADKHNYDYAIECYINGLALWPDAVDEGHKPLWAVAFARLGAGGKKPGMLEKMKFSSGAARDPLQGMLTAERLLARDPRNLEYMEGVFRNAHKAGYEQTCFWLGPILLEEVITNVKANQGKLTILYQAFEEWGDRCNSRGDVPKAVIAYGLAVKALEALHRAKPDDVPIADQLRNLSGKLIIAKGKFEAGDFRESLRDADLQREMFDKDRMVKDSQRMAELIERARQEMAATPNEPGKVLAVVDLMLRRGRPSDEEEAIKLLMTTYERTNNYQFKLRADDIRMRQLRRQAQRIIAEGDRKAAGEHLKKQIDFEIEVFKERVAKYATDARHKYELGKRYFQAHRYDEAIPVLQVARVDPKTRVACNCLIAQCFFQKSYYDQAINLLLETIKTYEITGDDVSKELHYWLARSYEASGQKDSAIQTYGQIIQWEYNYRDVRQRLEALQKGPQNANHPPPGA